MDRLFKNKSMLSILIFGMLGIVYLYILNLRSNLMFHGVYWFASFVFTVCFYYSCFIISTVIQIILIQCFNIFPLKVFSIYPFTYDGQARIHPIRLLYNIEGFSNSLILNLLRYIDDEETMMKKMKQLLRIRKISILITYCFIFLIIHRYDVITILVLGIAVISTILLSYFQYGTFWYGYDYLYGKGPNILKEFLFSSKSIMFLNAKQYDDILYDNHTDPFLELSILENYLYRSILENNRELSIETIRNVMEKYIDPDHFFAYDLTMDTKRLHIIKLIGWTGIKCQHDEVIELSIEFYSRIYEYARIHSLPMFQTYGLKTMRNEIELLKSRQIIEYHRLKLQDIQHVFSYYDDIS